jgi:exportin-1
VQEKLTSTVNQAWRQEMEVAAANEQSLTTVEMQQSLHNLLLSNISICKSLGGFFLPQMSNLYAPMLDIYQKYSQLINVSIQPVGPLGIQHATIKRMRSIKRDILKLIETFVEMSESTEHLAIIAQQFVPTLMDPILSDYDKSLNDAKYALLYFMLVIRMPSRRKNLVVEMHAPCLIHSNWPHRCLGCSCFIWR